jgi:hypothetical protein
MLRPTDLLDRGLYWLFDEDGDRRGIFYYDYPHEGQTYSDGTPIEFYESFQQAFATGSQDTFSRDEIEEWIPRFRMVKVAIPKNLISLE